MLPVLATLDLSEPAEGQAYDFCVARRASRIDSGGILDMRRQGDWLLCVVCWNYPDDANKPYSLAEVGLMEKAFCRQDYATAEAPRSELERRCTAS